MRLSNFFGGIAGAAFVGILLFGSALDCESWTLALAGVVISAVILGLSYKVAEWAADREA